jgi:HK97 family phage prohead protease
MSTTPERRFSASPVSLVAAGNGAKSTGRTVRGYAALFNSRSAVLHDRGGEFVEVIAPGAFDGADTSQVHALLNHDANFILARQKNGAGSLKIGTDSTGLFYEFESPATSLGDDVVELLRRGDLDQSSFAFQVAPGGDSFTTEKNGTRLRTIRKVSRLLDVSLVANPAYPAASVGVRNGKGGAEATGLPPIGGAIAARLGLHKRNTAATPARNPYIHTTKRTEIY